MQAEISRGEMSWYLHIIFKLFSKNACAFVYTCVHNERETGIEKRKAWKKLRILKVVQSGCAWTTLSILPTSLFDNFRNKNWVQKHQWGLASLDTKDTWFYLSLPGGLLSAGARWPCFPALSWCPCLPHRAHQSCYVQQVPVASETYSCCFFLTNPHSTLHPCKHHFTKELFQAAGLCWHGPTAGSCPFSFDVPFIFH